ncbi:MAG: AAA family ATPase [Deltaproteobacteria bacterium]|nr:AAA family ATPase [Deltaproteobacteria bacterium]
MLRREFALDEETLQDLKFELVHTDRLAKEEEGEILVWAGNGGTTPVLTQAAFPPPPQSPATYTPPHLAERIRAEQAALEARGAREGERKTITALFADLKGSTALIEGFDPEEARAIIDPALQLMMDAVHRYEGYVAQALGDGIFALFGAPIAHEDHPQRALFAALRMQEELRRYGDQMRLKHGVPLAMRVGVNTGEVVVRSIRKDDLHTDYVPVGHSTNLAARMEQMATPGSILMTEYTRKLVEGYFELKALGAAEIKGVEVPLNVYEVLGIGPLRTRLQVATRRGLTRFVGRQSELEQMRKALDQAKAGHGQIVGVMGEPGLGKSRLFYEFKLLCVSGCLVLEAYSVSYGKASPYLPLLELLKSYFQLQPQDDARTRRQKVIGKVLELDRTLEDTLPYLYALLGVEEQPSSLQQMDPQIRRQRTFDALKKLFLRESLNQPLILIFEDLHWIDAETQGFLEVCSESVASARLLLLTNYRPEYRPEWGQKTYYTQVRLAPLGRAEAEEFLEALLGAAPAATVGAASGRSGGVPPPPLSALKQLILAKTEGTPFFMEEIVQELVEQGVLQQDSSVGWVTTHPTTALQLPPTVQGVLAARIDRLTAEEKDLLHQLAVMGRQFPLSLVRQVVPQPEEALYRLLASLQRKEFLYEQPAFPEVEYSFKHALTQEVAYGTVLHERRKALHERTAQAMEALYRATLDEHYSDLAHHYTRSGNTEKAVEYLHLAGQQAVQRSANEEAITHLTTALELLTTLPDTRERSQQEFALQITLGAPLIATKGFAAPEVGKAYTRARELCQQVGEPSQLFPVLHGLWSFYVTGGELKAARELGEQLLSFAQRSQDSTLLLEAHRALGETFFWPGELVAAREYTEQGIALYDSRQHRSLAFLYAEDPGVVCRVFAAYVLWLLGYPNQGLKRSYEALTLARGLSHPHSLAVALGSVAWLHQFRREGQLTQQQAEATVALSAEQGFPFWLAFGTTMQGWALIEQGRIEEGITQICQGMTASQATGAELLRAFFLALLAEAYGKAGQAEEGLATLAEALTVVDKSGERFYEAELYRLKGTLTLKQSGVRSPRSEVPNTQSPTPSPQAEAEAEAQMLAEVYNWFTEGFDTKDLQEAKALLTELS